MPDRRRSRERQLAKLAARRAAERSRKRRQRLLAGIVAGVTALAGGGFAAAAFLAGGDGEPGTGPTPTASPLPSPSVDAMVACGADVPKAASDEKPTYGKPPKTTLDPRKTYIAHMRTSCGEITIELDAETAPNTVNSIVFLAGEHFYDGLIFHRIVPGFVIQGGDPLGNGQGGPGYSTVDPPPKKAQYPVGTVAMAKTQAEPAGTAGSQFFIVTSENAQQSLAPGGEGQYAIVGHVTAGMDVVQQIEGLDLDPQTERPLQAVYIETLTIEVKR